MKPETNRTLPGRGVLEKYIVGEAGGFTSLDSMLRDDVVDAVELMTPTYLHEDHAIACAEAGKHIHLQKPMANDTESAHRIVDAARMNGMQS